MAIMVSNKHMYVQFVDDDRGVTLASATTCGQAEAKHNVAAAAQLGQLAAAAATKAGIREVVVDRGGHKYHGRVKALVESAVKAGLVVGVPKEGK